MNIRAFLTGIVIATSVFAQGQTLPSGTPTDASGALSSNITKNIGIDDRRKNVVPLATKFLDEAGKEILLRDVVKDKPVLLLPIFYTCKSSCTLVTNGVIESVRKIKEYQLDRDYRVVAISIRPKDTWKDAAEKKKDLEEALGSVMHINGVRNGWRLLTGDMKSIRAVTDSVGFRFMYDEQKDTVNHPAGIIVLTADGVVSRYFYGVDYVPKMVLAALEDANNKRIGPEAEVRLFGCLEYDPTKGTYKLVVLRALQVGCVLTVLILATSITVMSIRHRQPRSASTPSKPTPKS